MSTAYQNLTPAQLREEYAAVKAQFDALKAKELKLNMARGKPGKEQLDLVSDILSILKTPEDWCRDCTFYSREKPQIGICACEARKKPKEELL